MNAHRDADADRRLFGAPDRPRGRLMFFDYVDMLSGPIIIVLLIGVVVSLL